jgi:hypothetical protein
VPEERKALSANGWMLWRCRLSKRHGWLHASDSRPRQLHQLWPYDEGDLDEFVQVSWKRLLMPRGKPLCVITRSKTCRAASNHGPRQDVAGRTSRKRYDLISSTQLSAERQRCLQAFSVFTSRMALPSISIVLPLTSPQHILRSCSDLSIIRAMSGTQVAPQS